MEKMLASSLGKALIFLFALTFVNINSVATVNAEEKSKSPSVVKVNSSKAERKAAYQMALEMFRTEKVAYDVKRKEINTNFRVAIAEARAKANEANSNAKTQMQKRKGIMKRKGAIMAAIVARDSAIEALGTPPVRPLNPKKRERS